MTSTLGINGLLNANDEPAPMIIFFAETITYLDYLYFILAIVLWIILISNID